MSKIRQLIQSGNRAFSNSARIPKDKQDTSGGYYILLNGARLGIYGIDYKNQRLNATFNDRSHYPDGKNGLRVNKRYGRPLKKKRSK